jgi:predicted nuclease of predicted toxin-antitoxin system
VKLLFDQDLSRRLVEILRVASKDSDFHQRSLVEGFPPKVVWVQRGNCSTAEAAMLPRSRLSEITAFESDPEAAFLIRA